MPQLSIRARFPLGTYLGHKEGSKPSDFPDTARLYSALVHAAGTGSLAVEVDGDLRPGPAAVRALTWLEEHPPSALAMPAMVKPPQSQVLSFRSEGVPESKQKPFDRKVPKSQLDAVAVHGYFGWGWQEDAPVEVIATIEKLCNDVSCLGESESIAVLEVAEVQPTHRGGSPAGVLQKRLPGELRVDSPGPGRLELLETAYERVRPAMRPTLAQDRMAWGARPALPLAPREAVVSRSYLPVVKPALFPWTTALFLCVDQAIPREKTIRWCVAVHRALCGLLGPEATSMTTGVYSRGIAQPANRLAIQSLPHETIQGRHGFVVLAPPTADAVELAAIEAACRRLHQIRLTSAEQARVTSVEVLDPLEFWPAPMPGMTRLWRPVDGLMPDTRIGSRPDRPWTFFDSALVAVGFLMRDRVGSFSGRQRYRLLADEVASRGVRVIGARRIPNSRVERYSHKSPKGVIAQPYTAWFDLNGLLSDRCLFALGQARHLGGGLMAPVDFPEELVVRGLPS